MKIDLAIIGGTGYYHPQLVDDAREITVDTKYGKARLIAGNYGQKTVAFMPRHGEKHQLAPHKINYRANITALKELDTQRVVSTTAVGSLKESIPPGTLVIIDQFIDLTKNREHTFFDGEDEQVYHTDFTEPYCAQLRNLLDNLLHKKSVSYVNGGTYICTEGPRYETPAEIKAYSMWGADVVGMTNVPEVTLARELGLCYATLSLVTNLAAGVSSHPLTHKEVVDMVNEKLGVIREIFIELLESLPLERDCSCWGKEDITLGG